LFKNKILLIPDILANGGGVTVSYFEWLQNLRREYWTESDVNDRLDRNISKAFADVYQTHEKYGVNMRKASTLLAIEKVADATRLRGLWP
jgi:glutamate dehydrogenase/leucine dehydrogenase